MKRFLLLLLVVVMTMMSLVGCGNKETDQVIATVNGNEIKMSEIQEDIKFVSAIGGFDVNNPEEYDAMIYEIINTYLIDYMCKEELTSRGQTYNKDYFSAAYSDLVDAYGSETALINYVKSFGLDKSYIEELCVKQARKATLSEILVEEYKKNISFEEAEILQYYIENTSAFKADEVRTFYFLTYEKKDDAEAALADVMANGFMAYYEAQKELQTCDFYGVLSHYEKSYFPDSAANILFAMEAGTVYEKPISTFQGSGYTIMYLSEVIENYTFTYDEMKEAIEEGLIETEVDEYMKDFFEKLSEKYVVEIKYGK